MPLDARKGAWRFDTLWKLPMHMVGSASFTDRSNLLDELESAFKRDVLERTTFPMHTINIEIKYKLSDLEVALNNPPNQLPVTGYIQSERQNKIDSSNLLRWLQIGVPLTVNWFGTTPIANGPDSILLTGMRKCTACLPSPHAAQARKRCVFAQIHQIWIRSFGPEVLNPTYNLDVSASCHTS